MREVTEIVDSLPGIIELRDFDENNKDLGLWFYSMVNVDITSFFAVADILWPDVIVYEGRVFLANRFDESVYLEMIRDGYSPYDVQRLLNHVHLAWAAVAPDNAEEFIRPLFEVVKLFWERVLSEYQVTVLVDISNWELSEICIVNE